MISGWIQAPFIREFEHGLRHYLRGVSSFKRSPFLSSCNFGGSTSSVVYDRTSRQNRTVSKNTQQHTWESIYAMFRTSQPFFLTPNWTRVFLSEPCCSRFNIGLILRVDEYHFLKLYTRVWRDNGETDRLSLCPDGTRTQRSTVLRLFRVIKRK